MTIDRNAKIIYATRSERFMALNYIEHCVDRETINDWKIAYTSTHNDNDRRRKKSEEQGVQPAVAGKTP